MKQEAFVRELKDLTPDVPEGFHRRVETFLQEKADQEVNMKESTKRALYMGGRFSCRALIFALVAVLMLGTVAFAVTRWGIFDSLSEMLGAQPPTADSVMQADLHRETVNGVEITIKEAGYDGKTLFLRYTYRLPDADAPLGEADRGGVRWLRQEDIDQLNAHNVGWWVDAFWINGQPMEMAANSGANEHGSEVPGEIVRTEYWRLDNIDVALTGRMEIALPIGERQDAEYRRAIFDKATSQYTLPDKGVVTFSFDAGDVLERVVREEPNIPTVMPDVTVRVSEVVYTPLMTYITLAMEPDAESVAAYKAEHGEGWCDEDGTLLWEYTGLDVYGEKIAGMQLVDGNGTPVFPGHWGNNGCGEAWAEFTYPYMDPAKLPEQLWLAPVDGDTADMTCAVRVK